jgi:hypothetical protein
MSLGTLANIVFFKFSFDSDGACEEEGEKREWKKGQRGGR